MISTAQQDTEIRELSRLFSTLLAKQVGIKLMAIINSDNAKYAKQFPDGCVCASHDHCDANMVMLDALVDMFEFNPIDEPGWIEHYQPITNDAWDLARANNFYVEDPQDTDDKTWFKVTIEVEVQAHDSEHAFDQIQDVLYPVFQGDNCAAVTTLIDTKELNNAGDWE